MISPDRVKNPPLMGGTGRQGVPGMDRSESGGKPHDSLAQEARADRQKQADLRQVTAAERLTLTVERRTLGAAG